MQLKLIYDKLHVKNFIWITSFFSLVVVYIINSNFTPVLNRPDIISLATFHNYDIGAVLRNFNIIFISFGVSLLAGTWIYLIIYNKYDYVKELSGYINPLAAVLIILLFFEYAGNNTISYFYYYYFIWIFLFIIFFTLFRKDFTLNKERQLYLFLFLACLAFSIGSLSDTVHIAGGILLLGFIVILKFLPLNSVLTRYITSIRPFFFVICVPAVAVELCRILQDRGYTVNSPGIAYMVLFFIILISFIMLAPKKRKKEISIKKEVYFFVFPVMIIGIVFRSIYKPYIENSSEIFELANHANAIVNTIIYNQIPFVDYLSSHAMSDTFFEFIYILFHGFNWSTDFMLYHSFFLLFYYIASYMLFMRCFGKNLITIFMVLLFPYLTMILPVGFFFIVFQIIVLYKLFTEHSLKMVVALLCITALGALWRFDVGLPMVLITSVSLIIYCILNYKRSGLKRILIVLAFFVLIISLAALIFYFRSPETFVSNFKQAIGYLTANQAHAYPDYRSGDNRMNFYHYSFFPLIGVSIICLIIIYRNKFLNKRNLFAGITVLVLLTAYLLNFQRGIVRHSLQEGTDSFTTIFVYLAISLFIYIMIRKKSYGKLVFLVTITFLCFNFKFREARGFNSLLKKYDDNRKLPELKRPDNISEPYRYDNIKGFMEDNFTEDATFIDLSNSPMLYFHLQRKVPSYFCQYMQNTVTFDLQRENIKTLEKMNVPFVVFCSDPPTWFDKTDGVPNTLRYYLISKYIYENYKPYYIIDDYQIWIEKGLNPGEPDVPHREIIYTEFKDDLILYPYLLGMDGTYEINADNEIKRLHNYERINIELPDPVHDKVCYALVNVSGIKKETTLFMEFYHRENKAGYIQFILKPEENEKNYIIPIDYIYQVYNKQIDGISLSVYDKDFENHVFNFSIYQE